jgi:hypothetical protein
VAAAAFLSAVWGITFVMGIRLTIFRRYAEARRKFGIGGENEG